MLLVSPFRKGKLINKTVIRVMKIRMWVGKYRKNPDKAFNCKPAVNQIKPDSNRVLNEDQLHYRQNGASSHYYSIGFQIKTAFLNKMLTILNNDSNLIFSAIFPEKIKIHFQIQYQHI